MIPYLSETGGAGAGDSKVEELDPTDVAIDEEQVRRLQVAMDC
jgi:hypothetical protein